MKLLNVDALGPFLVEAELVTSNELEFLRQARHTMQDKAKSLLTMLKTKGPTAHFIVVYTCLGQERSHVAHRELYKLLLEDWQSGTLSRAVQVTKRYPCSLELPKGIRTEKYFQQIRTMRKCHQIGGEKWRETEDMYNKVVTSPDSTLEVKIALTLESCTMYVIDNQPDVVISRVERARVMCAELHDKGRNMQALEGRCEWVLARLYRYLKDNDKAREHLDKALFLRYAASRVKRKL